MRWIRSNCTLILIYGTFLSASSYEIFQRTRFRDVQNWPSVPARIERSGGGPTLVKTEWWTGSRVGTVDGSYVDFEYSVEGRVHRGNRGTPNGGGLPANLLNVPWRAHYKPTAPELAVLDPVPYEGRGWLLAALVSGILVAIHLCLSLPGRFGRHRLTGHGVPSGDERRPH